MIKILFCNAARLYMAAGHKRFDAAWTSLLGRFAQVTLVEPEEGWYDQGKPTVKTIVFDAGKVLERKKIVNSKLWELGPLKHLNMQGRAYAGIIYHFVLELDRKEKFDYLVFSQKDFIMFDFIKRKIPDLSRVFWIDHSCMGWKEPKYFFFYKHYINKIHHIVMEKAGVEFLAAEYGIERSRIHYIPHMLNPVFNLQNVNEKIYDIVGISNSNQDDEIYKIIQMEEEEHFFEKNKIRAIFRSRETKYQTEYLTVFAQRLGFSFEEYYGYILNCKIVMLPFGSDFGIRSSGTIMDAISNRKPVLGSKFHTLLDYHKQFPHVCQTYCGREELMSKIKWLLEKREDYGSEYEEFQAEHSNEFIVQQMKAIFQQTAL